MRGRKIFTKYGDISSYNHTVEIFGYPVNLVVVNE